ncbi:Modification methylase BsoBI [Halomicronema hongdechloris C2206]|uniref:site-specific DNA-methyltransferase (cytosine-N(4)-specific) n=1 Tax=Halomicronema hongdechloris C2206 TaxID=1641165 RepID=A0A1Z3HH13_9CYAN|nr:DNA methyltransferase [Halomicronema hongdechloris]ASC69560.1 Modification methylase BsoBI [Halomicronema hongdechloris C2206]
MDSSAPTSTSPQPQGWSSKVLNQFALADRPVHDWYRSVLSFPPHLVRHYLDRFAVGPRHRVLDPFVGTGTTLVECKRRRVTSVGIEANPMAHFACRTKVNWQPDPTGLLAYAQTLAQQVERELRWFPGDGLRHTLPEASERVLLKNAISPQPLHKILVLLVALEQEPDSGYYDHGRLALVKAALAASNLRFAPEASVVRQRQDAPVVDLWLQGIDAIASDLQSVRGPRQVPATVHRGDARQLPALLPPQSIDAVITSPPYPNEKDYTRTTRLESVLLGFIRDRGELRRVKQTLIRSNSRSIYSTDDDDRWIQDYPQILALAQEIERSRAQQGKTSGFSRLYSRVVTLYFGGMARHLAELRPILRPGAQLAYVVGDQASYLGVLIQTGQLLADIAACLGYEVTDIDLFRSRRVASKNLALREEVVVLRWPGP